MKPTDISQLIADLRNYQTTLDENVVICDRRVVDGSAEIMLALAAHIAMMEDRICTHPPAPDATRGDPVARVVEWLRKENGICDCHARCETECGCGAWDDWKTKPLLEIADAIEQSFANKT